ncbi:MAG: light-harvesting protein [Rhodobacteraceae bacterium]|nr:light-harvesting protein [Paracoccaceae bacterium]
MNNAKMWLVLAPSFSVPVFLGAVAVGSFSVHVAVLSNTSRVSDFLSGQPLGTGDEMALMELIQEDLDTAKASYVLKNLNGTQEIRVLLPDGTVATAFLKGEEILASADGALH